MLEYGDDYETISKRMKRKHFDNKSEIVLNVIDDESFEELLN